MPHIDARTGEVVIRIVYDGPPEAGKTTNLRQLGELISLQRRGESASPGSDSADGRTEYFDWLDFAGGYLDGRRVRCQLVSVPGQASLSHRRELLLTRADVVVYVVDSRRTVLEQTAPSLAAALQTFGASNTSVVIQANKQDDPAAVPLDEIQGLLGLGAATVVRSIANRGEGVMETFVVAARIATERTRAGSLESLSELPAGERTPDALHHVMRSAEEAKRRKEEAAREEAARAAREREAQQRREEEERRQKEEAQRRAREEAERRAKEEAERRAKEEAERRAKEEAERRAKEEAERRAKEEAEKRVKAEAARKAREDAARRAKADADAKARLERAAREREERARREREEQEAAERRRREMALRPPAAAAAPDPEVSAEDLHWSVPPPPDPTQSDEPDARAETIRPGPGPAERLVPTPPTSSEAEPTPSPMNTHVAPSPSALPEPSFVSAQAPLRVPPTSSATTLAPATTGFWAWLRRFFARLFGGGGT